VTARLADVAIVGGGLMGSWTALFLARRGQRVVLIEKGVVGAQASGVNFGNLRLQGRHLAQYPLSLRSHALWEDIDRLVGEGCEVEKTGHLYLAANRDEHDKLEAHAEAAERNGLAIERVSGDGLRRRWPWLGEGLHSATYCARDATANPRLVTPAVARAAQRLGVDIVERCSVTSVRECGGGFVVETDRGIIVSCGVVVNAAGAWAVQVAEQFGETAPMFALGPRNSLPNRFLTA
jgi:sarcosine oxidase subunit beta